MSGHDAVELLMAGADAVQVGTATFRDPRAPWQVLEESRGGLTTGWTGWSVSAGWPNREAPHRQRRSDDEKEYDMTEGFAARVAEAVDRLGPLCAGIDPWAELLHAWGLGDDAAGLRAFCQRCVEGFTAVVPVVKPQVAFFERHGSAGMAELERTPGQRGGRRAARHRRRQAGRHRFHLRWPMPMRGWGRTSPLAADAVTVHPYLGLAALAPLIEMAGRCGRGVVVVTRSSNPEGRPLQKR